MIGKKIIWIVALIIVISLIVTIGYGYYKTTQDIKNPIVTMEVENYGTVKMELYPQIAPENVKNFVNLINNGYYNGLTFHRIVKDFMIQGGDKQGNGKGGVEKNDILKNGDTTPYSIKGEFIANNIDNKLKFEEGVLGMARSDFSQMSPELVEESYNSSGSQFFITTNKASSLNGLYTSFGKVVEGMDVVKKIAEVEVKVAEDSAESGNTEQSVPTTPVVIKNMKVDTFGIGYGMPELLESFDYNSWMYKQYGIDPNMMMTK